VTPEYLQIISAVVLAIVGGCFSILTLYLKSKWNLEKRQEILSKVTAAVKAAELIGTSMGWLGEDKKKWVIEQLASQVNIPEEELSVLIESAVLELKASYNELIKDTNTEQVMTKSQYEYRVLRVPLEACKCKEDS
jgi:hypothetical protein